MTEELFREEAYLKSCEARVVGVNERGGVILDRTVFYPTGGGQPGDRGIFRLADGRELAIATTVYDSDGSSIVHVPADGGPAVAPGDGLTAEIDWDRRYRLMRAHTALHLLCAVVAFPVTGGQVGEAEGRLDFDIPEAVLEKDDIARRINAHVAAGHPVSHRWITDEEMAARPELVRTMLVKPPSGRGRVRLVEIADCDLQPCGGTHVASTAEIGEASIEKIEKKGAINRRVRLRLA
ncbi:MAG: alanyl-tRNA editing protein [Hyphomicrobiaceae bacterium]